METSIPRGSERKMVFRCGRLIGQLGKKPEPSSIISDGYCINALTESRILSWLGMTNSSIEWLAGIGTSYTAILLGGRFSFPSRASQVMARISPLSPKLR